MHFTCFQSIIHLFPKQYFLSLFYLASRTNHEAPYCIVFPKITAKETRYPYLCKRGSCLVFIYLLREEHRLRMHEDGVIRTCGPKMEAVRRWS
jgi:hypothetical protein